MAIQESNITLDGLVHTLDDRDRVAAQLVNENANTFTGANTFSSTVALNGAVTIGDAALVASGSVSVGSLRTFLASDTTPDVASGSYWLTHASTQTLTHFNGGTVSVYNFGYTLPINHAVGSTDKDAKIISYGQTGQKVIFGQKKIRRNVKPPVRL